MGHADPNSGNGTERRFGKIPDFIRLNLPAGHVEIPWALWTGPTGLRAQVDAGQSAFDAWFLSGPRSGFRPNADGPTYAEWYAALPADGRRSLRIDAALIAPTMPSWAPGGA